MGEEGKLVFHQEGFATVFYPGKYPALLKPISHATFQGIQIQLSPYVLAFSDIRNASSFINAVHLTLWYMVLGI